MVELTFEMTIFFNMNNSFVFYILALDDGCKYSKNELMLFSYILLNTAF